MFCRLIRGMCEVVVKANEVESSSAVARSHRAKIAVSLNLGRTFVEREVRSDSSDRCRLLLGH